MTREHVLKCWPEFFDAVERGDKNFELRKYDRDFCVGDTIVLQKYDPENGYVADRSTGQSPAQLRRRISYVMNGGRFGLDPGYVALGLQAADTTTRAAGAA